MTYHYRIESGDGVIYALSSDAHLLAWGHTDDEAVEKLRRRIEHSFDDFVKVDPGTLGASELEFRRELEAWDAGGRKLEKVA